VSRGVALGPSVTADPTGMGRGGGGRPGGGRLGGSARLRGEAAYRPLPVLVGLAVIAAIFQAANPRFLSPANLTNLTLQIATIVTVSLGVVLVLLLAVCAPRSRRCST